MFKCAEEVEGQDSEFLKDFVVSPDDLTAEKGYQQAGKGYQTNSHDLCNLSPVHGSRHSVSNSDESGPPLSSSADCSQESVSPNSSVTFAGNGAMPLLVHCLYMSLVVLYLCEVPSLVKQHQQKVNQLMTANHCNVWWQFPTRSQSGGSGGLDVQKFCIPLTLLNKLTGPPLLCHAGKAWDRLITLLPLLQVGSRPEQTTSTV